LLTWSSLVFGHQLLLLLLSIGVGVKTLGFHNPHHLKYLTLWWTASRIIQNMDPTSEPCNDFYQYACGGWLNRHVIPESSSRYSIFDKLRDDLEIILKGEEQKGLAVPAATFSKFLLRSNILGSKVPPSSYSYALRSFPALTFYEFKFLEPYWVMEEKLSMMNSQFNKRLLIDMFVWNDDRDSRSHIIYVSTTPGPSAQLGVREAYLQFMISIAKMIRADLNFTKDDEFVENEMLLVMKFETEIANVSNNIKAWETKQLLSSNSNVLSITPYQVSTPFSQNFNWTVFIQIVMSSVNINILENEEVVVYGVPYLQNLQEIISKYPARTIQNYLVWRLVQDQISNLSHRFKEARVSYRKALYGTSLEDVQWRECVRYVNNNMESAVGALYVKQSFAGESKRMVSDLIQKVREVFIETLNELQWMDELSKKRAQEKATAIREQIGYPDYILEEQNKKLDDEYYQLNFKEDMFFENTLENLKSNAQKSLKKLREKVDQDVWIIGAAVVNAFYSPNRNQIVFPAGILQPPFFSKQQLQALNFGGIGMVIGHEITHGFDDNGRNFDKDGNMLDWWSNFSSQHFKEQTKCMVYQYSNYSWDLAGGQHVSGLGTLGENIADNGGIRQAYKAYIKWVEQEGQEPRLPGLNLTHEQLFFINFAQVWCGSYRPEYASQSIKTDVHSPLKYRVMGSLQNFEAFSEAFHCHTGTVMHPEEKCRVW
uniref:Membrane metalloendopeptidase like 1 n=1 Tax=Vombatus ursinus TaxID=29139 RepID=A0A4X2M4W7_VOMUR